MDRAWTHSERSSRRSLVSLRSLLGPDGPDRLRSALALMVETEAVLVRAAVRLDDDRAKGRVLDVVTHGRQVRHELEELLAAIENGPRADRRSSPRLLPPSDPGSPAGQ